MAFPKITITFLISMSFQFTRFSLVSNVIPVYRYTQDLFHSAVFCIQSNLSEPLTFFRLFKMDSIKPGIYVLLRRKNFRDHRDVRVIEIEEKKGSAKGR
jgi:hypothetical protein